MEERSTASSNEVTSLSPVHLAYLTRRRYLNVGLPSNVPSVPYTTRPSKYQQLLEASVLELRVLSHEGLRLHENIANILAVSWESRHAEGDAIADEEICPILIMELACANHPTLTDFLDHPKPLQLRLELIRDVFEGISAIHTLSVVYGDIKPDNVLIFESQDAGRMVAKLSDFGFCQPAENYSFEAGGTPYWNAPECLAGAPSTLKQYVKSNKRDIYAFGLLACYLLTEEAPFGEATIGLDRYARMPEITRLKLQDHVWTSVQSKFGVETGSSNIKLVAQVEKSKIEQVSDRNCSFIGKSLAVSSRLTLQADGNIIGLYRNSNSWKRFSGATPIRLIAGLPSMLVCHPDDRPDLDSIRTILL